MIHAYFWTWTELSSTQTKQSCNKIKSPRGTRQHGCQNIFKMATEIASKNKLFRLMSKIFKLKSIMVGNFWRKKDFDENLEK